MNARDMQRVLHHLRRDPVVKAVYDAKSEEIGPNIYRFKAEIGARAARAPLPMQSWNECVGISFRTSATLCSSGAFGLIIACLCTCLYVGMHL